MSNYPSLPGHELTAGIDRAIRNITIFHSWSHRQLIRGTKPSLLVALPFRSWEQPNLATSTALDWLDSHNRWYSVSIMQLH